MDDHQSASRVDAHVDYSERACAGRQAIHQFQGSRLSRSSREGARVGLDRADQGGWAQRRSRLTGAAHDRRGVVDPLLPVTRPTQSAPSCAESLRCASWASIRSGPAYTPRPCSARNASASCVFPEFGGPEMRDDCLRLAATLGKPDLDEPLGFLHRGAPVGVTRSRVALRAAGPLRRPGASTWARHRRGGSDSEVAPQRHTRAERADAETDGRAG